MMRSHSFGMTNHLREVLQFLLVFLWLTSISCYKKPVEGSILIVQKGTGKESGFELALADPGRPEKAPVVLVKEFHELESPVVSYQGGAVLFQAKKLSGEPWQIWEYDLEKEELNQVTNADSDCVDPAYLPDGRIVYSHFLPDYSGYHALETSESDGSDVQRITFGPVDFRSPTLLRDGRILAFAKEMHPKAKRTQLMVMRPDGTKIELFYESDKDKAIAAEEGIFETADGRIVFSETNLGEETGSEWVSVDYNQPSDSRVPFDAKAASSLKSNIYMPRSRPKKLPSAVNLESETALLVCTDANLMERAVEKTHRKSIKLELLGLKGSLGTVDLEEDGSVYLKIQADMPFRMQTLDSEGEVIQGPSSWLQMRPNERRGCVGCHAGHTRVPENRQPLAVQKEPVEIPLYRESIMASRLAKNEKK